MATTLRPDPTFYPSPRQAIEAPAETLAYVVQIDPEQRQPDAIAVFDTDGASTTYGTEIGRVEMPGPGDELHHFGWNACSSALCPYAPHPHVERRYLVVPGLRSSRIHVIDTKPDPAKPKIVKTIGPDEIARKAGYSRPHTVHCGPDGIYISALGNPEGDAPGGVFIVDHDSFEVKGPFEADRGPQQLAYDFWWHLGHDVALTSEWGTPNMVESGVNGEILLAGEYGHQLHLWDLPARRHRQVVDLGKENQMALELRPAHEPTKAYGFVGVVTSLADLSGSIWKWQLGSDGKLEVRKVITIPAEPAKADELPPLLQPFGAVPPLVTDINLTLDDRWLYVSCWGTGELKQYDVSDPHNPKETGSVHLGGIVRGAAHPAAQDLRLRGGPQMVEISRGGRRVYTTNSLYSAWDDAVYPDGVGAWMAKIDANTDIGGMTVDPPFFPPGHHFPRAPGHQTRRQGG